MHYCDVSSWDASALIARLNVKDIFLPAPAAFEPILSPVTISGRVCQVKHRA